MKKFQLIKSTEPHAERKMFFVLFGYPGIGKTSLSFTMPGPVLHLDFDKGIDRAVQKKRPDYFSIEKFQDFSDFVNSEQFEILISENSYKSVVIDTVGTLLDDYIAPALIAESPKNGNRNGGLTLQGWGALGTAFNNIKSRFQSLGLNICAVCHAKEEGDESQKQVRLAVKGGSTDILYRNADMIGLVYPYGKKRIVDFNPTELHIGKNITGLPAMEIPNETENEYDTFLESVIEKCYAKMNQATESQKTFHAELGKWRDALAKCETTNDFDVWAENLKKKANQTLRNQLAKLFQDTIWERGFAYNKETGKVEERMPQTIEA